MFHNKSQGEPRLKRCSSSTGHFILAPLLFCLHSPAVTSSGLLFVSSLSRVCSSANSFSDYYLYF